MGQEASSPVDENTPPETLESRTLDGIAKYIKDGRARKIVVMTGAGISTSAGIPDFRSPDTGLYANLARLNLPYAEAVFDISYFRRNPDPFYTLAHELYPGKYRPTIAHAFIRLLHDKRLLLKLFTQNIDCLEREAGVPGDMIVEAHGSFASQSCIDCHAPYPADRMRAAIDSKTIPYCPRCGGLVKPDIVFFGEQLPSSFFLSRGLPAQADLCIVMGTSLTVQPFASLPEFVAEGVPRLLINMEMVGGLGSRADDVLMLGDCDEGVRRLAEKCGWLGELERLWAETAGVTEGEKGRGEEEPRSREEALEDEVEKLTREVEETLKLSESHKQRVNEQVGRDAEAVAEKRQEAKDGDVKPTTRDPEPDAEPGDDTTGSQEPKSTPYTEEDVETRTADQAAGAPKFLQEPKDEVAATDQPAADKLEKQDEGGGGLDHVYAHIDKKSSL